MHNNNRSTSPEPMTPERLLAEAQAIEITPDLFDILRHNDAFADILRDLDVSEEDSQNLFDTLDSDVSGSIDIDELLVGIEKLRGDARRSDIVSVNLKINNLVSQFSTEFQAFHTRLNRHDESLQRLIRNLSRQSGADSQVA